MSAAHEAELALTLAHALAGAARDAAGGEARLVSITCDVVGDAAPGEAVSAETAIVRATRSLVFAEAALAAPGGRMVMTASAVYRVVR